MSIWQMCEVNRRIFSCWLISLYLYNTYMRYASFLSHGHIKYLRQRLVAYMLCFKLSRYGSSILYDRITTVLHTQFSTPNWFDSQSQNYDTKIETTMENEIVTKLPLRPPINIHQFKNTKLPRVLQKNKRWNIT